MKNMHVERLRQSAKASQSRARTHYARGGIEVSYEFDEHDAFTWWTHTSFVLNDYCVELAFTHPRCEYYDRLTQLAKANSVHLGPSATNWLSDGNSAPIYQKVGRSRKKVIGHRQINRLSHGAWVAAYKAEMARLQKECVLSILPSIDSKWTPWSRRVKLCAPMPLRNEGDLRAIAILAKRLLKRETTLQQEFPEYEYTREDWLRDNQSIPSK